jgi:hypothetical protein
MWENNTQPTSRQERVMWKLSLGAMIGAIIAVVLSVIVGAVEANLINRDGWPMVFLIEPWRAQLWLREDLRDWRNFYALGIVSGGIAGTLWVGFAMRRPGNVPAVGTSVRRTGWKVSLAILLLLAVVGASLVITPVRYAAVARCRGNNLYHGMPASYWVARLRSECQPVQVQPDLQGLAAIFGGTEVDWLIKTVAEDVKREAVPELVEMLHDPNPTARVVAARTLRQMGPDALEATPELVGTATHDPDARARFHAALALVDIGSDAQHSVPVLVDAFKNNQLSGEAKSQVLEALGKLGPRAKDAVPALIDVLRGSDPRRNSQALDALKKIDAEAAAEFAAE